MQSARFGLPIVLTAQAKLRMADQIAELLYPIDFIVGEKNHKQTPFHDDPTLFECETNQQNKIPCLVNVSYRSFLGIQ